MEFRIKWTEHAITQLERLGKKDRKIIFEKVEKIKEDSYRYVKKLRKFPLHTLRVGQYRVIISIKNNKAIVLVLEVGQRSRIYKKY